MDNNIKKKVIKYNILKNIYTSIITLLVISIILIIFQSMVAPYMKYIKIGYLVIIIYQLFACFIKPFIDVKTFTYSIDSKKVEYTEGVFTIDKTIIPIGRIQQVTTTTDPLLNKLGLIKVSILTTTKSHYLRNISVAEGEEIVSLITNILHNKSFRDVSKNDNLECKERDYDN